jgi:isoleucyl-tRNA synthetase
LSISNEILKRVVESYRRIRNTLRFLLANTADFDPARHAMAVTEWIEIDRYALALAARLQEAVIAEYDRYEFHTIAARLQTFCSEDLGAFYLDILKDRLYTGGADSRARRSAQNALYHVTQTLVRLMAPILSFTAEEVWTHAGAGSESVFLHTWYGLPAVPEAEALLARWDLIRQAKGEVQKELEGLRVAGKIGSSLQAEVEVHAAGDSYAALAGLGDDLRFAFITSQATVRKAASEAEAKVLAAPSLHAKCDRCWHYRADVGANPEHPTLCARCEANLHGAGELRQYA